MGTHALQDTYQFDIVSLIKLSSNQFYSVRPLLDIISTGHS